MLVQCSIMNILLQSWLSPQLTARNTRFRRSPQCALDGLIACMTMMEGDGSADRSQ